MGNQAKRPQSRSNDDLRHEFDDCVPRLPALALGVQLGALALNGVVVKSTVVLRAAGAEQPVLSAVCASVLACGASAIMQDAQTSGEPVDPSGRDPVGRDWWHDFGAVSGQWSFEHRCVEA